MRMRTVAPRATPVLLAVAAVLLTASAAAAAADPHAAPKSGGLDFLALHRYDLGIFTLIVFGLLVAILGKFAWPKIAEGLDKREATLKAAKTAAEQAKTEAEAASARLQAEFAAANDKIRGMLEEARRDADALRARERETGQREAAAERDRAIREIQAERDAAKQEIYNLAVDLATTISTKAVRKSMTADDHRRLVDEALGELKAAPRG